VAKIVIQSKFKQSMTLIVKNAAGDFVSKYIAPYGITEEMDADCLTIDIETKKQRGLLKVFPAPKAKGK